MHCRQLRPEVSTYSENAEQDEKDHLEKVPIAIVRDLKHDQLSCPIRVHSLQSHCRHQRTKETSPHCLGWEVIAHFLGGYMQHVSIHVKARSCQNSRGYDWREDIPQRKTRRLQLVLRKQQQHLQLQKLR